MGLDMYAFITRERFDTDVDFKPSDNHDVHQLHYWRKHPNLHGWMEQRYRLKGGKDAVFNCARLTLDVLDLDELERTVRDGCLPSTSGFFFGQSDGSEHDDDLAFIARARQALAQGYSVFYDSWW